MVSFCFLSLSFAHVSGDMASLLRCAFADSDSYCSVRMKNLLDAGMDVVKLPASMDPTARLVSGELAEFGTLCYDEGDNGTQGCIPQLHQESDQWYNELLANTGNEGTCSSVSQAGAAATAASGVVDLVSSFWCLANEDGVPCPLAMSTSLHQAGLDQKILQMVQDGKRKPDIDLASVDIPKICNSLSTAGCCAESFLRMSASLLDISCESNEAIRTLIVMLPRLCELPKRIHGNGKALPNACPGFDMKDYDKFIPRECPKSSWADDLAGLCNNTNLDGCPTNMCELGCTVVHNLQGKVSVSDALKKEALLALTSTPSSSVNEDSVVTIVFAVIGVSISVIALIAFAAIVAVKYKREHTRNGPIAFRPLTEMTTLSTDSDSQVIV